MAILSKCSVMVFQCISVMLIYVSASACVFKLLAVFLSVKIEHITDISVRM